MHVTTHIPDRPGDGMLTDVGGKGFPTMVFLNGDGKLLATHSGPRTTAGFDKTAGKAQSYVELSAKAAQGDRDAEVGLLSLDLELGGVSLDEAKKRIASIGALTPAQRKDLDGKLINLEFDDAMNNAIKGDRSTAMQRLGKALKAMVAADRIPSGDKALQFWSYALGYADQSGDVALFEKGATALKKRLADEPRAKAYLDRLDKRLAELKKLDKGDG